jgi:hypothetical protein
VETFLWQRIVIVNAKKWVIVAVPVAVQRFKVLKFNLEHSYLVQGWENDIVEPQISNRYVQISETVVSRRSLNTSDLAALQ